MKKRFRQALCLFAGTLAMATASLAPLQTVEAHGYHAPAIDAGYNNRIIDDVVYADAGTMSAAQIQSFLQSKVTGGSCPDTTCLYEYHVSNANGLAPGNPLASQFIYNVSQQFGINPQVILATLQKEQSLITDDTPIASQFNFAMGYGCPEGGSCSFPGFDQQVYYGAKYLRNIQLYNCDHNARGYTPDSSYWKGNTKSIDGKATLMGTCATGALYRYTPHRPDSAYLTATNGNHYYGNYNFVKNFKAWFGSLWRSYNYSYVSQTATPSSITPGVTTQDVSVQLKNTGSESWPVDGAFRLGTDRARDHKSAFATFTGPDPWLSRNRPSAVDSIVGAPGETMVDPGQVAQFDFTITIPDSLAAGNYRLYVRPVMDGVQWLPEDYGIYFPVPVAPQLATGQPWKTVYERSQFNFQRGSTMYAKVAIRNTGRTTWMATGSHPVRFATTHPRDRHSSFVTTSGVDPWLSANRASTIDGTVTDLDSMTVDTADKTIEPGQTALFTVYLTATPGPGTYREFFGLVQEGVGWFPDPGYNMLLKVVP